MIKNGVRDITLKNFVDNEREKPIKEAIKIIALFSTYGIINK